MFKQGKKCILKNRKVVKYLAKPGSALGSLGVPEAVPVQPSAAGIVFLRCATPMDGIGGEEAGPAPVTEAHSFLCEETHTHKKC